MTGADQVACDAAMEREGLVTLPARGTRVRTRHGEGTVSGHQHVFGGLLHVGVSERGLSEGSAWVTMYRPHEITVIERLGDGRGSQHD